jgi:hypothetical protein
MELRGNKFKSEAAQGDLPSGNLSLPVEDPYSAPETGANPIRPSLPGEEGIPPSEWDVKASCRRFNQDPVSPSVVSDAARTGGIDDLAPAAPTSEYLKLRATRDDSVAEETQPRIDRHETPRLGTGDKSS